MNSHHVMVDGRELKIVGEKCVENKRHDDSVEQFENISVIMRITLGDQVLFVLSVFDMNDNDFEFCVFEKDLFCYQLNPLHKLTMYA